MPWDEGLVNSLVYDAPDPNEGRVLSYAAALREALDLALEDGLDLAADALGGAGGVGHQPGDVVEEAVRGRGHGCRFG